MVINTKEVWKYLDERMLFSLMGLKGERLRDVSDKKHIQLKLDMEEFKARAIKENYIQVKAVYDTFIAKQEDNQLIILDKDKNNLTQFTFELDVAQKKETQVGIFVLSAGYGLEERVKQFKDSGQYFDALAMYALATTTAEAAADYVERECYEWEASTRVSPGYPKCPGLEEQRKIWELLQPERHVGVSLTEQFMMKPEASVSAFVLMDQVRDL
jgi:5-methyltetrahydrofolate--homocysteine methyltransferase